MILLMAHCSFGRDAIALKQAHVDKLYASLKDLAGDRRLKLDEVLKLYMLNRDIEDLEQWIAEREVVAGSHELGQDFEHVTVGDIFLPCGVLGLSLHFYRASCYVRFINLIFLHRCLK